MSKKIFIVGRSEQAEAIWDLLLLQEYQVLTASSGLEALHIIKEGASFDVVLLDERVHDMEGLILMQILRFHGVTAPVVLLISGLNYSDDIYLGFGIAAVLRKPSCDILPILDKLGENVFGLEE